MSLVFSTHRLGQKIQGLGPGVQTCVEMTSTTPGLQYDSHQGPIQLYRQGQWDRDRAYSIYLPKTGHLGTCWGMGNCQGDFPQETSATAIEPLTPRLGCLLFLSCSPSVVGTGGWIDLPTGVCIPSLSSPKSSKTSRTTEKRGWGADNCPYLSISSALLIITISCVQAASKAVYETINNNPITSTRPRHKDFTCINALNTLSHQLIQRWLSLASLQRNVEKALEQLGTHMAAEHVWGLSSCMNTPATHTHERKVWVSASQVFKYPLVLPKE